jgi:hypothetical protein
MQHKKVRIIREVWGCTPSFVGKVGRLVSNGLPGWLLVKLDEPFTESHIKHNGMLVPIRDLSAYIEKV